LRAELESAKLDLETARAAAANAQNVPSTSVEIPSGSTEVLEQRVAERRVELEAELETKEKALQERFDIRSEKMKTQLNTKLKEFRERNEAAIEELKAAHATELEQTKAAASNQPAPEATQKTVGGEDASTTEWTADSNDPLANMTEPQIQELVASNATLLGILKRNIQNKLKSSQDQMKAEFEKQTEESKAVFDQQKKEAEERGKMLEGKKFNVKFSMAERKIAIGQAKLDVVETAARDTPQRPVGEVWAIAKDAKPIANISVAPGDVAQAKPTPQAGQQPVTTTTNPFGGHSTTATKPNPFGAAANIPTSNVPVANHFTERAPSLSSASGIPSSLPAKPPQGRGQAQPNTGQSAIPRPGSSTGHYQNQQGAGRGGSGIPRGGGPGGRNIRGGANNRGGHNNQRGGHQNNAPASPSNLNPTAAQFAPPSRIPALGENKRPHDGAGGNAEKRPRQ
jgi:nucleoprotein TPR